MTTPRTIKLYRTRIIAPYKVIKDAYGAHRLFWRAFPAQVEGSVQPFTYAEQDSGDKKTKLFLMQSMERPDFSEVLGVQAETKEITLTVKPGDFFFFRLRANPTYTKEIRDAEGKRLRTVRAPIITSRGVEEWLDNKAAEGGFSTRDLQFSVDQEKVHLNSKVSQKDHEFKAATAVFNGSLVITDPEKFETALAKGVGRGRSYGYSMLLIGR